MTWINPTRNFDRIQFETLRKTIDTKFNTVHDELSDCFYNGKPFRMFGILMKDKFEKLHGLIFHLRDIAFHQANLAQPKPKQIPQSQYNEIRDVTNNLVGIKTDVSAARIAELKAEGIELVIT